ncbi:hypothetical protein ACLOJK_014519 [Asimina triloba]
MSSPVENPKHDDLQVPSKKVVEAKDAAKDWKEANAVDVITDTAEDYSKELRRVIDKHDRISQLTQEEKEKIQKFEDSISSRMEELKIKFKGEIEEMKIEFCEEIEKLKKDTETRENALLASRHALTLKAELWEKAADVVEQITEELMTSRRAIVTDIRAMGLIPRAPFANFKVAIDKNSFESLPEREKILINFFAVTKQYHVKFMGNRLLGGPRSSPSTISSACCVVLSHPTDE